MHDSSNKLISYFAGYDSVAHFTRDWNATTMRSGTDKFGQGLYHQAEEASRKIVDAVAAIANERGASRAQVALAWLLHKPAVTAPIVGVTKPEHLTDAIAAVDLKLSNDEIRRLEEPYVPQRPEGF